jgi:hypothetical protein
MPMPVAINKRHAHNDTDACSKNYTRFVVAFVAVNILCGIVAIYFLASTRPPSLDEQDQIGER